MLLTLKVEEGIMSKEYRQPLEAGKGKEMDSPLEIPEETQPCQTLTLAHETSVRLVTCRPARYDICVV